MNEGTANQTNLNAGGADPAHGVAPSVSELAAGIPPSLKLEISGASDSPGTANRECGQQPNDTSGTALSVDKAGNVAGQPRQPNAGSERFLSLLLSALSGKKTHATCALMLILLFGSWQKWWILPPEIYSALLPVAIMFLRQGVKSEISQQNNK